MRHAFEVSMTPTRKETDNVCFNCHEYKRTTSFQVQISCRIHQKRQIYSAYLCKNCLEVMEDSEDGGVYLQICPLCVKEILKFKPSTEVPDYLPEDM